jgi:hypothetical protein
LLQVCLFPIEPKLNSEARRREMQTYHEIAHAISYRKGLPCLAKSTFIIPIRSDADYRFPSCPGASARARALLAPRSATDGPDKPGRDDWDRASIFARIGILAGPFHASADRTHRIRRLNRPMMGLIRLNLRGQDIEPGRRCRAEWRRIGEIGLDLGQCPVVIGFGPEREGIHVHHTGCSQSL